MSKTTNGRSRGQRGGSDQGTRVLLIVAVTVAIIVLIATGQQLRPASAQTSASASGIEPLDYAMIGKIREEGLNRSEVMDHISWLTDVYGPRLTGSPAIKQASEWVQGKFTEWELSNINEEKFAFGKGWSLVRFTANMIEPPRPTRLLGIRTRGHRAPKAWRRPTWCRCRFSPPRTSTSTAASSAERSFSRSRCVPSRCSTAGWCSA